jgi:sphingolipid delta-4 desaturase
MESPSPFRWTEAPDPHRARARQIRRDHPEAQKLAGRSRLTAALGLALVLAQLGAAAALALLHAPWWLALALAWIAGAFLVHALFVVMHEACHRLVFASTAANQALLLVANLPSLLPFAVPFGHHHRVHHRTQGQYGRDPDLPAAWEVRWFGGSRLRRFAWQLLFPFLSALRAGDPRDRLRSNGWLWANVAVQGIAVAAIALLLGPTALLYLAASTYFVFALHPLFGRFVQEHFLDGAGDETTSYYGPLNRLALNFGYHVEHHDFPAVPWHRLPRLTRLAPEAYTARPAHRSWTWLWLRFTFGSTLDLDRRLARPARPEAVSERPRPGLAHQRMA